MAWLIVRTVLPINTFIGHFPLSLEWTFVPYVIRNRLIDPSVTHFRFFALGKTLSYIYKFPLSYSIVLIRRSLKCTVEWFFQYSFNRADVNCVPLSDTMVSGRPWVANMLSSELIVAEVLVDVDVLTSCPLGMRFRQNWLGYSIDGTCEIDMESAMVFFSFLAKELDFREMDLSWIIYAAICWII